MTLKADLSGKTALITGASSGLGRHFAQVLAQAGARVARASSFMTGTVLAVDGGHLVSAL